MASSQGQLERIAALAEASTVAISRGCICSGDMHQEGHCRMGEPLAWTLDPEDVLAIIRESPSLESQEQ